MNINTKEFVLVANDIINIELDGDGDGCYLQLKAPFSKYINCTQDYDIDQVLIYGYYDLSELKIVVELDSMYEEPEDNIIWLNWQPSKQNLKTISAVMATKGLLVTANK